MEGAEGEAGGSRRKGRRQTLRGVSARLRSPTIKFAWLSPRYLALASHAGDAAGYENLRYRAAAFLSRAYQHLRCRPLPNSCAQVIFRLSACRFVQVLVFQMPAKSLFLYFLFCFFYSRFAQRGESGGWATRRFKLFLIRFRFDYFACASQCPFVRRPLFADGRGGERRRVH